MKRIPTGERISPVDINQAYMIVEVKKTQYYNISGLVLLDKEEAKKLEDFLLSLDEG